MYIIALYLYICLQAARILCSVLFHRAFGDHVKGQSSASEFTVIQPIVSGDPELEICLKSNIMAGPHLKYLWVVDDHDLEAIRITREIACAHGERIRVLVAKDIPKGKNEKVWKQKLALPYAQGYVLCLDDDVLMDFDGLDYVKSCLDKEKAVVFGIPRYRPTHRFFSNLVVGFVNGNSLLTYPVLERLNAVDSLMGACYAFRKEWFADNHIFERVEDRLSDEYEIAGVLREDGIGIRQIALNFSPGTNIDGFSHYAQLMKRWMVFANIYLKGKVKARTLAAIVLPTLLPPILLALGIMTGFKAVVLLAAVFVLQAMALRKLQKLYGLKPDPLWMMGFETAAQLLQPLHFLHSVLRPGTIIWRKNTVKINSDRSVTYERMNERTRG